MKKKHGTLTDKQQAFCEEYVRNGYNGTRAYLKAFPDCTNPDTAGKQASCLNKKPEVIEYIKKLQAENVRRFGDMSEAILRELALDAFGIDETGKKSPTWQKSVDLLQKQLGLQNLKMDVKAKQTITINILGEEEEENGD